MSLSSGRKRKTSGKGKIVLASGVFDLIHLGHIRFLEKAKEAGGSNAKLTVVVARDSTIEKEKGSPPVLPEDERLAIVDALKPVDMAILGNVPLDIGGIIRQVKPDVIAVGHDQDDVERKVREYVAEEKMPIEVVKIQKFGKDMLNSSSKIKLRIRSQLEKASSR